MIGMNLEEKIVVVDSGYESYAYEEELFGNSGYQFEIFPGESHDREGKKKFAKDAVGILVRWTEIDDDFIQAVPKVKAVVRYGVGYDNINIDSASRHNVKVSNVQGYANHAVSDHAIALIYACIRALPQSERSLKEHYTQPPIKNISEIHTLTLGIIGLGRIGGTLCTKAKTLFKEIIAYDPYIQDDKFISLGARKTTLEKLIENSDVISLHCNLTEETRNLINSSNIACMIKQPILINTSRGAVVNDLDLLQGLKADKLHSAGLDVFHEEPPGKNYDQLLAHPRVISTGHYAWYSKTSAKELQEKAAQNLLSMLKGEIPEDCLNP
jgi:D-3-phosphoglycerate dehydrogenase